MCGEGEEALIELAEGEGLEEVNSRVIQEEKEVDVRGDRGEFSALLLFEGV